MISLELIHQPLTVVVELMRARQVSPVELLKFVVGRVNTIHRQFNVLVEERFDDALRDAQRLESEIASGVGLNRPLLGLPFSVKANIAVRGMRQDMGTWALHGTRASQHATVIQRLIDAGAILVCTTNLAELGLWHDTTNPLYGRTRNPWRPSRVAGGSSGGEGALLAAGGTLFGIATDLDGSIRLPAAFCGLFGHKPTRGLVPLTGQYPFFRPQDEIPWRALESIGPLARHAGDLALILEVIAGPCSSDPMSLTASNPKTFTDLHQKRIAVIENPKLKGVLRTSSEIRLALHKAKRRLQEAGAIVGEAPRDLFYDGHNLWRLLVHRAVEGRLAAAFASGHRRNAMVDIIKWFGGHAAHSIASSALAVTEYGAIDSEKLRTLDAELSLIRKRFDAVFTKYDALLIPVHTDVPPYAHLNLLRPMEFALTGLVNTLGLPSTAAPTSVSSGGLPVGVQIVGRQSEDFLTIAAAEVVGEFIPAPTARFT